MEKNIRFATENDVEFIFEMIKELAVYEKAADKVETSIEQIREDGFGEKAYYKAVILELDNKAVGMALFYNRYSTWKGKSLYLEDLYIRPEFRGNGLGMMGMQWLAEYAVETKCYRFEWQVLDWNEPSIQFYKTLNADLDSEWINCRLEGNRIQDLANRSL